MFYEVLLFPHNNVMDLNNVSCMDVCQVKLLHLNANWMNVFFFCALQPLLLLCKQHSSMKSCSP